MRRATTFFALLCAALTVWACEEATPEEKVAKARARYSVTLNGFFAKERPMAEPEVATEGEEMPEEAAEADGGEGEEGADPMDEELAGPQLVNILLDLIVQHDLDDALPGITVDLIMVDADKNEKGAWKIWIDTAGLPEANQKQVTHELEGVDYEEGDAFSVEIRSSVPPEEYASYREFAEAAP